MAARIQSVKGARDVLPPETAVWTAVEAAARRVFALYGYQEIRTPIFEETELFVRTVGETTDIVGKEMYSFTDKGGRNLTLRPESTAPVVRAYLEHGMQTLPQPVKLYYVGPHFRYERPQKGRYRQFHQIGAELIGGTAGFSDAEVLLMLVALLRALGFTDLVVLLNTVGDAESRSVYRERLTGYLRPLADRLSEDSRRRLEANPLRILDSKSPQEQELLAGAPRLQEFLSERSRQHLSLVRSYLEEFQVPYEISPRLVRGLDYYTGTVFEIVSAGLGAQNAICGGGAYEGLVEDLGGPATYGVGFAIGEDRLVDVLPENFRGSLAARGPVLVAPIGTPARLADPVFRLVEELRRARIATRADGGKPAAIFKRAEQQRSPYVLFLGEDELKTESVVVRDMAAREQRSVPRGEVVSHLLSLLGEAP